MKFVDDDDKSREKLICKKYFASLYATLKGKKTLDSFVIFDHV